MARHNQLHQANVRNFHWLNETHLERDYKYNGEHREYRKAYRLYFQLIQTPVLA